MKIVRMSLFVASAFCVTHFCPSLAAEEIKYPSPDGRFALRITAPQEGAGRKVDLIETSGKILVDLGKLYIEPETSLREETILVWSADSKWAAYATRGPGYRSGNTTIYYWNDVAFEEVRLPANLPEPKMDTSKVKLKGYAVEPVRWLKPGELELSNELSGFGRDDGKKYTAKIVITVQLTAPHASVKKVGKTKTEVDE
ncbi:MAG: hypothetical protein DME85_14480 [Verrucomicrobia bacterium]|nr:MAG: hypothetical protein DME85_14480 [Verrucomicrobiota bacterium]